MSDPQEQERTFPLFSFDSQTSSPMLSFCAEPNGEVAESIIPRTTLAFRERRDDRRWWARDREEPFFITPHPSWHGFLLPTEKVFLGFLKQWILQLRASPSCRMTWGWGDKLEEESRCYWCSQLRNHTDRINHHFYCTFETILYRLQQPSYLTCCFNHKKMYLHFDLE